MMAAVREVKPTWLWPLSSKQTLWVSASSSSFWPKPRREGKQRKQPHGIAQHCISRRHPHIHTLLPHPTHLPSLPSPPLVRSPPRWYLPFGFRWRRDSCLPSPRTHSCTTHPPPRSAVDLFLCAASSALDHPCELSSLLLCLVPSP